ncbi:SRPBCC domain-containing protein [Phyllobacterium sp. TAF24]|uniref:SRPBCC domain-containing protein n=1 Tax=Phyllobacterium sp. TAF24 TaxID=3233068 RepID=UPI003F958B7B
MASSRPGIELENPEEAPVRAIKRGTAVFERRLGISPQAAFGEWSRPVDLHLRRDRAGNLFSYVSFDFRLDSETVFGFGTPDGKWYRAKMRYEEIAEGQRITYVLTIKRRHRLIYLSTVTISFRETTDGCVQTYSEQGTSFDGEPVPDHLQWYAQRLFGKGFTG